VYKKTYSTRVANPSGARYSKYVAWVRLPLRGRWRLRAYHPCDTKHAATYSPYGYVRVR
jgi:hypothetical protein